VFALLGRVVAHLDARSVHHCLIGAGALSAAGYSRATQDLDLLTVEDRVLEERFWAEVELHADVEVRDGRLDHSDPLAGLVRIENDELDQVDVVVGRHPEWQVPLVARSAPIRLGDGQVRVAEPADLVLLKLFAGSTADDRDVLALLKLDPHLKLLVDLRVGTLPTRARRRWARLLDDVRADGEST